MFNYITDAETEEEADAWYEDKTNNRRTPDLLPRDEVARAINAEVKAGRGSPHGGVLLDIASRRSAEYIARRLPSMHHQFKELADVDITKEPMEVGPTCHYIMGGVRVEADTAATTVPGLYAAGEVAAGLHGANRLGGNSLSDLLVFGRRAGLYAAQYAQNLEGHPSPAADQIEQCAQELLAPFNNDGGENPYSVHMALQDCMQNLVGIIRAESELKKAQTEIASLKERLARVTVEGHRQYNPGWNLALDLQSLLAVAEATTMGALERKESRGGHTREDHPGPDPDKYGKINLVLRRKDGEFSLSAEPLPEMPDDLKELFEEGR